MTVKLRNVSSDLIIIDVCKSKQPEGEENCTRNFILFEGLNQEGRDEEGM
jgi:hypothetical protein